MLVRRNIRYRSGFEVRFANDLKNRGIPFEYEHHKITYVPRIRTYTPDFFIKEFGFFIETKGWFSTSDRVKHLLIREQHPELDIRFIFSNPNNRLDKNSMTTYGGWCERYGFLYGKDRIPDEWMILKTTKKITKTSITKKKIAKKKTTEKNKKKTKF